MVDRVIGWTESDLSKALTNVSRRLFQLWRSLAFLGLIVVVTSTLSSMMAHAEETIQSSCTNGNLVRRVVVVESELASGLTCEVIYWKDTEAPGVPQILWNARQDAGYCYSKALVMMDKLTSMGWSCELGSPPDELIAD